MAFTDGKARDGWQHQADRHAANHKAVGKMAVAATEQVRRRPLLRAVSSGPEAPTAEVATSRGPARAEFADLDEQAAREAAAEWIVNARRETLTARAARNASTDKRLADLEGELASARERIAFLENENHSLQSSVDLTARENVCLSERLKRSDAVGYRARWRLEQTTAALGSNEAERDRLASAGKEARARLEQAQTALAATEAGRVKLAFAVNEALSELAQTKTALATAKAERITLSFAVDEVNEKRQAETSTLNQRLGAMTERAVTAEKLLTEARQKLLALTAENCSVERKLTEATVGHKAAQKKLAVLQKSLTATERQAQELEQSRSELMEVTTALLKAFKKRGEALAGLAAQREGSKATKVNDPLARSVE